MCSLFRAAVTPLTYPVIKLHWSVDTFVWVLLMKETSVPQLRVSLEAFDKLPWGWREKNPSLSPEFGHKLQHWLSHYQSLTDLKAGIWPNVSMQQCDVAAAREREHRLCAEHSKLTLLDLSQQGRLTKTNDEHLLWSQPKWQRDTNSSGFLDQRWILLFVIQTPYGMS